MATTSTIPPPAPPPPPGKGSLEPGDHLPRDEFERRYDAIPDLKKAELIEGVVHMPSPVRWDRHASPHIALSTWLGYYWAHTAGVQAGADGSIRLDMENMPQPDAALIILPACGGQARISADDYVEAAPELVAEVAASSVSIDRHSKFRAYLRNGVREYVLWRVQDQAIDWFILRGNHYEELALSPTGFYQSEVFPGLWLDPAALTRFDLLRALQVLQQGIGSPEHAAFVTRLRAAAATQP